jgi:hypothetical protein
MTAGHARHLLPRTKHKQLLVNGGAGKNMFWRKWILEVSTVGGKRQTFEHSSIRASSLSFGPSENFSTVIW